MTTITTNGFSLMASVCLRCGARIYPATGMPAHMARHAQIDFEMWGPAPYNGRHKHVAGKGRPKLKASDKKKTVNIRVRGV